MPQEPKRFDPEEISKLGHTIIGFSLNVRRNDLLLIKYNPGAKHPMDTARELALGKGAEVRVLLANPQITASRLKSLSKDTPQEVYTQMLQQEIVDTNWANKLLGLFANEDPHVMDDVDGDVMAAYRRAQLPIQESALGKRHFFIFLPTPAEAEAEGMPYELLKVMCFRAYNRPWRKVRIAQDILNGMLNNGKTLEFHANEDAPRDQQTHLAMSIEGQTPFANSTFKRNIGSELFSAPKRGTLDGRLVLPYRVNFSGKILPNLTLDFEGGTVMNYYTEDPDGIDWVAKILQTDEGASEVGEVAFGTNPEFDRPLLDPTKVEKVLGFHIALGRALSDKKFDGKRVNIDNGVRSAVHIDLACVMLRPWGGRAVLDGKLIQQDGRFLDPRLAIISAK